MEGAEDMACYSPFAAACSLLAADFLQYYYSQLFKVTLHKAAARICIEIQSISCTVWKMEKPQFPPEPSKKAAASPATVYFRYANDAILTFLLHVLLYSYCAVIHGYYMLRSKQCFQA